MKKLIAMILAAVMLLSLAACGGTASTGTTPNGDASNDTPAEGWTIGICQWVQHPALDAATKGFKDAVIAGLGETNVKFMDENANNETTNCTSIMNSFVTADVDLIMANATPALAAAYNATEIIPILGTSVTEYGVALGIENFSGTVGGNVSGTSDLAPLDTQAQMILDWVPEAKTVGLLYCSTEPNSQYQVDQVQKYLEGKGIECKQFAFSDASNMNAVTQSAADYADAIYVPTDNTVATYATAIDEICRPAKVPVIAGESGICGGCGIATLSIDYYDLGVKTGEMAVDILKNGADISTMAIAYTPEEKLQNLYNEQICQSLGLTPLEGYEKLS